MTEDAGSDYLVTRHAPVRGDDDVLWVAVARWVHADGSTEWCLESWDDAGEANDDLGVEDEAAAVQYARDEFGVEEAEWRPGPQPWARPD